MSDTPEGGQVNTISLSNFYKSEEIDPGTGKPLWKQHEPVKPPTPPGMILTGHESITPDEKPDQLKTFQNMISGAAPDVQAALQIAFREQLSTVTDRQEFQDILVSAERVAKASAEVVHIDNVDKYVGTIYQGALRNAKTFMTSFGIVGSDLIEHPEKFRITTSLFPQEIAVAYADVKIGDNMTRKRAEVLDELSQAAQLTRNRLGGHIMEQSRATAAKAYIANFKNNSNAPATLEAAIALDRAKIEKAGGVNGKEEDLRKNVITLLDGRKVDVIEAQDFLSIFEGWIVYTPSTAPEV